MPATVAFITRAIRFKADIVEEDPYENGVRAFLNLGHTFGHAIERVSQYRWRHGDAVSVGLLAAVRLSQVHGLCSPQLPYRVESLLRALNMPVRFGGLSSSDIRAAMNTDKKRQGSKVRFVLLRDVGDPLLVSDVPDSSILAVLESLRD
jgi:3-dehydroquinate synthetase